ncbi:PDDEXK nuclease domain-containing protein [Chitinophaga sancti]|uniref:PDDEXK nuclease domain-containing protein n=1 Tax=Chitinophaga sancti TaxID=1004 RepID=UPI0039BECD47
MKKAFPSVKGFSSRNLLYMKQFAEAYPITMLQTFNQLEEELSVEKTSSYDWNNKLILIEKQSITITQQPAAQFTESVFLKAVVARVTWSHQMVLLDKVTDPGKRFWYMLNTIEHGNSRNILASQIDTNLFERQVTTKKITNFSKTLPEPNTDFATYIMKDPYIFDFVQAKEKADERNIEQQLTDHITKFLLELGKGFAFIGKQVHIEIGGQDFYIDLLLYHIRLHAYVVVELKARDFQPEDTGKLNFYINVVNDKLKGTGDSDTIGMLLCKGKNEVMAEYALKGIGHPIGVAEYQLAKAIPEELKSQLPDISDLENELN